MTRDFVVVVVVVVVVVENIARINRSVVSCVLTVLPCITDVGLTRVRGDFPLCDWSVTTHDTSLLRNFSIVCQEKCHKTNLYPLSLTKVYVFAQTLQGIY